MELAERARDEAIEKGKRRVRSIEMDFENAIGTAIGRRLGTGLPRGLGLSYMSPAEAGLDVRSEIFDSGVIVAITTKSGGDEPQKLFVTPADSDWADDPERVEIRPVGACNHCDSPVPLGDVPAEDLAGFGRSLMVGRPWGHDCAKA